MVAQSLIASTLLLVLCATSSAQTILYQFNGTVSGGQFGFSVGGAGDTDGDGYSDMVVGSPSGGTSPPGSVRVFSGLQGSLLYTIIGYSGVSGYDQLGWSVSGVGDANGDGFQDFAATANGYSNTAPGVVVFSGWNGFTLFDYGVVGWSVDGAGDVDGAGFADVIAGGGGPVPAPIGYVYVFSGRNGSVLHMWSGAAPWDLLGWSVSGAGDVDGDGYADVILGIPWEESLAVNGGSARVHSGKDGALLYKFSGAANSDQLGRSVGGGGDVDGGGRPDLLVGVPFDTSAPFGGRVGIFSGEDGGALRWLAGDAPGDEFGFDVADGGDLDGDGFADVILGAPKVDSGMIDHGRAYAFSGVDGSLLSAVSGQAPLDSLGFSVDGAGDVNQDGFPDLIAGANNGFNGQGLAVVFSGACFSAPPQITQQPQGKAVCSGSFLTLSVTATGPPPVTYQWRKDGVPIPGETNATLLIFQLTILDAGTYDAVVSNCGGSVISDPAVILVDVGVPPPVFTVNPQGVALCSGNPVSFSVQTSGGLPIGYQWRKDGVPIPGATSFVYAIASVTLADAGVYDAVATNCGGSVASATAVLLVDAGVAPPSITQPPLGASLCVDNPISMNVGATGASPLTYQWRHDGIAIPGATSTVYSIPAASLGDAGDYDVVVSNCVGSATSATASVRVAASLPYGTGTAGTSCTPGLFVGCPLLGASISPLLIGGFGGAAGAVAFSTAPASIAFLGGILLVQPPLVSIPLTLGGIPGFPCTGSGSLTLIVPNDPGLLGLSLYLQGFILDPGAAAGVAMSAGVQLTFG